MQVESSNVTVMVGDFDRAVRFYTETLGFRLHARYGNDWAEVDAGGMMIGLHPEGAHTPKAGTTGALSIGLQVASIDASRQELESRGVRFHGPTVQDSAVKLAHFADPDGNPLYLCQVSH